MSLSYKNNRLHLGRGDLLSLIQETQGHPCYVYDLSNIRSRYEKLCSSLAGLKKLNVHYALKANAHPEILRLLKGLGSGVDVVSGGELKRAMEHGFEPQDAIFSGVAKSREEISLAIDLNIKQINVESSQELERIGEIATQKGKKVSVAFRMNPEVNPVTHPYITTGMTENKFGMDASFLPELVRILKYYPDHLNLRGLTMHIGSQLLELKAMEEAIQKLKSIAHDLGLLGFPVSSLDIGGGVGVHYDETDEQKDFAMIEAYGQMVVRELKSFDGEVLIEPGRVLVARAGVLLCQVEYLKETSLKKFVIVNTGMHHLMRPALYQARHRILPLIDDPNRGQQVYDVVGPICESSDFLAKNRLLPEIEQGDYLAICDAGAYGMTMANHYNFHEFPKEIILP